MPDFAVQLVGGAQVPWTDPASSSPAVPSRLNPNPAHLHTYRRYQGGGPFSVATNAVVGGVVAPMDGALGGRLFTVGWAEWSGPAPPIISQAAGQSSAITIQFLALHLGHYLLSVRRPGGGAVNVPFDVEV